jgi:hypothetical protein
VQRPAIGEYEAKPYEPGPETFLGQILEHVRKVTAEGRTIRAWQIQRDLKLDQPPHRELSKLFKAELVYRIPPAPGVYSAKPPETHTGTPVETLEPTGETNAGEESGE